jgi:hypothetical protein
MSVLSTSKGKEIALLLSLRIDEEFEEETLISQ